MEESPRWLAMKGRYKEANALVDKWENEAREKGHTIEKVPDDLILAESSKREVKQLPTKVLFTNKALFKRSLPLCFAGPTSYAFIRLSHGHRPFSLHAALM